MDHLLGTGIDDWHCSIRFTSRPADNCHFDLLQTIAHKFYHLFADRSYSLPDDLSVDTKDENSKMPIVSRRAIWQYGFALLAVIIVTLLRLPLDPVIGKTAVPFILYFPAVMLSGWYGRFGPGVLATISGAMAALYFNVEPLYHFSISSPAAAFQLALFVAIGLLISAMNEAWHRANQALAPHSRQSANS